MVDSVSGGRIRGFIVIRDEDGLRHCVKPAAVIAVSDGDDTGETTVMTLPGNRAVVIRRSLDDVLEWFG
jgi:hypothetical protein